MLKEIKVSNTNSGNPGPAGWNAILPKPESANVLSEQVKADWLVIGGGFAGLAAARRLSQLRPSDKTVLVEAIRIADGPAGRGSGFMIDLPHDISSDNYAGATEQDLKQTEMNRTALDFAQSAAQEYGFTKEVFDTCGKIYAAATPKGDKHNKDYQNYIKKLGVEGTWLDSKDIQEVCGTDYYISGLYTPGSAMIQPAAFVRGLAEGLKSKVDIFEDSPVISLQKDGEVWTVKTPKGTVTTPKIILAVNGHMQSFGFMKQRLMHIFLYASMTRVLTDDEVKRLGGKESWNFVPADPMGSTVRKISGVGGHRIVVRNKFDFNSSVEASDKQVTHAKKDHDKSFVNRFPMLKDVDMEHSWGGRLCLSWNGVPVFGEIEDGIFAASVQNGLGASKGILSGVLAAEHAVGETNAFIQDYLQQKAPTRLPPEPFASIGANVYLQFKEWQAGKEK